MLTKRVQLVLSLISFAILLDSAVVAGETVQRVYPLPIVELKSVETVIPVHKKQLLTYLRLADKRLGLLINFEPSLSL